MARSELVGGLFQTTAPTLTDGDEYPLRIDSSGRLLVNISGDVGGVVYTLFDYDANGNVSYVGKNTDFNAATSDNTWTITKFWYDVNGNVTQTKTQSNVAWDDRASLSW